MGDIADLKRRMAMLERENQRMQRQLAHVPMHLPQQGGSIDPLTFDMASLDPGSDLDSAYQYHGLGIRIPFPGARSIPTIAGQASTTVPIPDTTSATRSGNFYMDVSTPSTPVLKWWRYTDTSFTKTETSLATMTTFDPSTLNPPGIILFKGVWESVYRTVSNMTNTVTYSGGEIYGNSSSTPSLVGGYYNLATGKAECPLHYVHDTRNDLYARVQSDLLLGWVDSAAWVGLSPSTSFGGSEVLAVMPEEPPDLTFLQRSMLAAYYDHDTTTMTWYWRDSDGDTWSGNTSFGTSWASTSAPTSDNQSDRWRIGYQVDFTFTDMRLVVVDTVDGANNGTLDSFAV